MVDWSWKVQRSMTEVNTPAILHLSVRDWIRSVKTAALMSMQVYVTIKYLLTLIGLFVLIDAITDSARLTEMMTLLAEHHHILS